MTAPTTDQQASPSTTPSPSPAPDSPRPVVTAPGLTMGQRTRSVATASPPALSDAGSGGSGPADPLAGSTPPTATPSASPKGRSATLGKEQLRGMARGIVSAAGEAAHLYLAREGIEKDAGLYTTLAAEDEGIGDPIADIVARRLGGNLTPDVADLIGAGVVVVSYLLRTAKSKLSIWRAERSLRRPDLVERPTEPEGTP
jgi:hypothetical protein